MAKLVLLMVPRARAFLRKWAMSATKYDRQSATLDSEQQTTGSEVGEVTIPEEQRICPHCGFRDVPILVVNRSVEADGGIGWRCHSCHRDWTDGQFRPPQA